MAPSAKAADEPLPKLTHARAFAAQTELHVCFRATGFRKKLGDLEAESSKAAATLIGARQQLILAAMREVLPKYGFETTARGAVSMLRAISAFSEKDLEMARTGEALKSLLGMKLSTCAAELQEADEACKVLPEAVVQPRGGAKPEAREPCVASAAVDTVEVRLRSKLTGLDVHVLVSKAATMSDVLDAAADTLGNEALRTSGRLVKLSPGGKFLMAYQGDEPLGSRRRLTFLWPVTYPRARPLHGSQVQDPLVAEHEVPAATQLGDGSGDRTEEGLGADAQPPRASSRRASAPEAECAAPEALPRTGGTPLSLSPRAAFELQLELHSAFASAAFQKRLLALLAAHGGDAQELCAERTRLVRAEQQKILPKYGLACSDEGVRSMLQLMEEVSHKDAAVATLGAHIGSLLLFPSQRLAVDMSHLSGVWAFLISSGQSALYHLQRAAGQRTFILRPGDGTPTRTGRVLTGTIEWRDDDFKYCAIIVRGGRGMVGWSTWNKPGLVPVTFTGMRTQHVLGDHDGDVASGQVAAKARVMATQKPTVRKVVVALEHCNERVCIDLPLGATVKDLRRALREFGVLRNVPMVAKRRDGMLVHLSDDDKPTKFVTLKGVLTLSFNLDCTEEDVLRVLRELNVHFESADFQSKVEAWRSASRQEPQLGAAGFRQKVELVLTEVLPKHNVISGEELAKWSAIVERFGMRFPAIAELVRKSNVLKGFCEPEDARQAQRASRSREVVSTRKPSTCYGNLSVSEITSEQALVARKAEAQALFDLLYRRIYEENRQELWGGHEVPSRAAVSRKYLEPPATTLLRCEGPSLEADGPLGAAVVFSVEVSTLTTEFTPDFALNLKLMFAQGLSEALALEDAGAEEEEEDPLEDSMTPKMLVGYVHAFAAVNGSEAAAVLVEHLYHMAEDESWDMITVHSIRLKDNLKFWERRGFHTYPTESAFRLACFQNCGVLVSKQLVEEKLPSRPGCAFLVKFTH